MVRVVEQASSGHTRLFIQIIDFLSIRRRPTRQKYFAKHFEPSAAQRRALPGLTDKTKLATPDGLVRFYREGKGDDEILGAVVRGGRLFRLDPKILRCPITSHALTVTPLAPPYYAVARCEGRPFSRSEMIRS